MVGGQRNFIGQSKKYSIDVKIRKKIISGYDFVFDYVFGIESDTK